MICIVLIIKIIPVYVYNIVNNILKSKHFFIFISVLIKVTKCIFTKQVKPVLSPT